MSNRPEEPLSLKNFHERNITGKDRTTGHFKEGLGGLSDIERLERAHGCLPERPRICHVVLPTDTPDDPEGPWGGGFAPNH